MARVTRTEGAQAVDVAIIELTNGETATVNLDDDTRRAQVPWDDGGVTWTCQAKNNGDPVSMRVWQSLAPSGDDFGYWVEDDQSPFSEPAQGAEQYRIQRLRFTNNSNDDAVVIVSSAAKFEVET